MNISYITRIPLSPSSALPYLKGPEESPTFAMYFTRQWQDTLLVSLTNFLSIIFKSGLLE